MTQQDSNLSRLALASTATEEAGYELAKMDLKSKMSSGTSSSPEDRVNDNNEDAKIRLGGWQLHGTTFSSLFGVFLANLEVTIVSTSLVTITDYFKSFNRSSWIITSYLLTYCGFLMIWAKFSDHFGRRQSLCLALTVFTVASASCGAAQTSDQLIVFRAFQGIGGSGLLSLNFVILPELVEPRKYALYAAFTSIAVVLGFLFGPLFAGGIVGNTTWRWIFFPNLPACVVTLVLLVTSMPASFPYEAQAKPTLQWTALCEIDFVGAILAFGISAFLVSALEIAGSKYAWSSALVIVLLVLTGLCILGFLVWEKIADSKFPHHQALLSWRLMSDRVFMGVVLITFLSGVPFTVAVIQIPQQWQTVGRTSALTAGVRLLPYSLLYSVGTIVAMILTSKLHVPPVFVVWAGSALQTIGFSVISFAPVKMGTARYACETVVGLGVGAVLGVLVQFTPQYVRGRDQAIAMGAITQFRALGSVIGYAIATNAFNAYIEDHLTGVLPPEQATRVLDSVSSTTEDLPKSLQSASLSVFSNAYDLQFAILIGFAAAQALGVGLMWEKKVEKTYLESFAVIHMS